MPKFTPPSAEVSFSENPTDAEISKKQLLAEPLLPIGGQTTAAENKDLAAALTAFTKRAVRDDYTSLEDFVAAHPKSAWDISLLTDLGALYRRTGWYGKAMDTWQQAWKLGQAATNVDTTGKAIIDRALVESIVMNARVGRMEVLPSLIKTADQRRLAGSSKERVEGAKQALALMKTHPESSFRCGPMAVEKLRNIADNNDSTKWKVMSDTSTQQGTSLAQLTRLSKKLGMDMIPAQRQPGSPVLAPAVVNWKVGHFAAITEVENGLIHLSDPTFGGDVWISPKALDAEASGYFLVNRQSLPSGWSEVTAEGAAKVWGKGQVVGSDDTANGNKDAKTCNTNSRTAAGAPDASSYPPSNSLGQPFYPPDAKFGGLIWGMASASTHMMLASLSVQDTPLSYTPPIGPPVSFQISYSQREAYQPSVFAYSNLGPLWTFNWLTYISDDPSNPGANVTQYLSGGGTITYTGYNTSTHAYAPQSTTGAILRLLTYSSNYQTSPSYELDLPDGSKQTFSTANQATPRNVFLTQTTTPQGSGTSGSNLQNNSLTFSYDSNYRMTAVTDGIGQVTILYYGLSSDIYKITKVTDPFGRSAYFKYNPDGTLQSSTDTIGIVSSYGYKDGAMQSLTTPYGATTFDVGQDGLKRWVQITDPQGGQERVETWNDTGSLISSGQYTLPNPQDIPAGEDTLYGQYRNTFYWDKKAMMDAPGNYHMAEVVQWLESQTGGVSTMTGQMEDYQPPLEARVYYNYPGQPSTNVIGSSEQATSASRMLDSGPTNIATQTFLATYNSLGKRTQAQDPAGRTTSYAFDSTNNVDLQSTKQQNQSHQDTVFSASYNAQHEPTTITEASGQQTTLQYYGNGQVETITDALGNTSSFTYGSTKYLQNVKDGSTGATTSYTYDALDGHELSQTRVATP
ncbi:MAG: cysteine peptidase family C39 domain-containing protein [Verrucomicrobiota bacterium]